MALGQLKHTVQQCIGKRSGAICQLCIVTMIKGLFIAFLCVLKKDCERVNKN